MCDPMSALAVASAGATIGGQVMQSNEAAANQAAAINAKNDAAARTIAAEKNLQDKSTAIFGQTLQPYQGTAPAQALNTAQAANTNAITSNAPSAASLAGGATTGNAPKVVQDSENSTVAARVKDLGQKGAALGNLTGYDSMNQGNDRALQDSKLKIGTIGDFAKQQATVGDALEQADVANSQKAPSPFGDLLKGAGQLGSFYAGKNGAFGNIFGPKPPVPTPTYGSLY